VFDRRSKLLSSVTLVHDLGVTCVAFVVAYLLRTLLVHFDFFSRRLTGTRIYPFGHYLPLLAAFLITWAAVGYFSSFYRDLELSNPIQLILSIVSQLGVVLVVIYAGLYLFRRADVSRTYVLLIGGVDFVLLVIGRAATYSGVSWMRDRLKRYHFLLIVGCGPRAREMAALIEESRGMGLRLIGFVDPNSDNAPPRKLDAYRVHRIEELGDILQQEVVDEIVFAVNMQELARLEPVMQHCADVGMRTRLQLEFLPAAYSRIYLEKFRDEQLLSLSSAPDSELRLFFKRIFDAALSLVALIAFSPALLCMAAMIRLTSPGPVLFRQTRCGLGGRRFVLYKFRSMINNAEQLRAELHQLNELDGPVFKITDDPRITTVGRWLRRFSLDELPQLWNILRGDMSFVGPRPAVPGEVDQYEDWQRRRLRMRPGLTCTWVLEGRNHVDFNRWMQLDLTYIDNWSLWLDFKIFLRTIPIVLSGRGAY
jgi:exopolysaccharide biosynthesis polyprenyl glycosylphosphotransferase